MEKRGEIHPDYTPELDAGDSTHSRHDIVTASIAAVLFSRQDAPTADASTSKSSNVRAHLNPEDAGQK